MRRLKTRGLWLRRLLACALALSLGGCAPVLQGRFIPDPLTQMTLTGTACGAGRAAVAQFMQDEVAIRVSVSRLAAYDQMLLVLEVPAGHQVRMSVLSVQINGQQLQLPPAQVRDFLRPVRLEDPLLLPGNGVRHQRWLVTADADLPRTAGFELRLPQRADSWHIRLPLLYIDGRALQLPELRFHYSEALELSPLNC